MSLFRACSFFSFFLFWLFIFFVWFVILQKGKKKKPMWWFLWLLLSLITVTLRFAWRSYYYDLHLNCLFRETYRKNPEPSEKSNSINRAWYLFDSIKHDCLFLFATADIATVHCFPFYFITFALVSLVECFLCDNWQRISLVTTNWQYTDISLFTGRY